MDWQNMPVVEIDRALKNDFAWPVAEIEILSCDKRKVVAQKAQKWLKKRQKEVDRLENLLFFERQLWQTGFELVAGVDEVGRGPLAGPVVAAAVILPQNALIWGVNDSKKLSHTQRQKTEEIIKNQAFAWAIGQASHQEIDEINIKQAAILAMSRAVKALNTAPQYILVDAENIKDLTTPQKAIIKGDAKSMAIGAASIIAKCYRDRLMLEYHAKWPQYGFDRNMGYPTLEHRQAIEKHGRTPIHRLSFMKDKSRS